jgi:pantothenate synthetase
LRYPGFVLEYCEIADETDLNPLRSRKEMIPGRKYYCCVAVKAGRIRLIDNIEMKAIL